MNLLKVSKNELVGITNHRLYEQILENVNETNVCRKFFAVPAKGTCLLKNLIIFAHFSWSKCEFLGFNFGHCQANERKNAFLQEIVDFSLITLKAKACREFLSLTEHSRRKHGPEKEVGAALMLNEIQKDVNPTPNNNQLCKVFVSRGKSD